MGRVGEPVISREMPSLRTRLSLCPIEKRSRVEVIPLTLPVPVSALLSVLEGGKAELVSVFAVVSGVSVCTEEVNLRPEDMPSPDAVSSGIEVDINRGGMVLFVISPAGLVSGEEKWCLEVDGVRPQLLGSPESGFPVDKTSGIAEETLVDVGVVPAGALEPGAPMVTAVAVDTGALLTAGVKCVALSEEAVSLLVR